MGFLFGEKRTVTRYLIELPRGAGAIARRVARGDGPEPACLTPGAGRRGASRGTGGTAGLKPAEPAVAAAKSQPGAQVCPSGGVCYTAPPWSARREVRAGEP